jgi:hypothetical protein
MRWNGRSNKHKSKSLQTMLKIIMEEDEEEINIK